MPAMITSEHLPLSITGPMNSRDNAAAMEKTSASTPARLAPQPWPARKTLVPLLSPWPMTKQQKVSAMISTKISDHSFGWWSLPIFGMRIPL